MHSPNPYRPLLPTAHGPMPNQAQLHFRRRRWPATALPRARRIWLRLPSPPSPPCATPPRRAVKTPVFFSSRRRSSSLPPSPRSCFLPMAWIWMVLAAGAVLLWAISLGRIFSSAAPSCVPLSPQFMPPLRGDRRTRNVMLVVAHPDDESMFFAPTILFLKSKGHNIHILCMSRGNADGLGDTRKEELYHACETLKIPHEQVEVLDHPKLQDGFHEKWDHELVSELVMEHVQLWVIDMIVTFDSYGVSGHPNHRDVHYGIWQGNVEAWELASLNILRKYSGPVDIWLSSLISVSRSKQSIYTLVNSSPSRSYEAMAAHRSQWVWFRRVFVMLSSYTYINMLQKI
ncbi:N-acetylglucosaminylphosphatidylinositol de-N-acetylase family protein [Zea mays]|uniref:N-acetylglucosaminylphosphatidylinositol deacetylase n=2 Tax=Zea mays TaxID=4577 RepID=A0A1D6DT52_MAIZE|nr:N-acetylglucosaminylphosphatidylinositol de-N-acetylase family protein [Zea mays]